MSSERHKFEPGSIWHLLSLAFTLYLCHFALLLMLLALRSSQQPIEYTHDTHLQIDSSFYLFSYPLLTCRGNTYNLSFAQLYANVLCDTRVTPGTMRSQYGTRLDFNLLCNTKRDLILYQSMNALFILFLQACFLCSCLVWWTVAVQNWTHCWKGINMNLANKSIS